MDARRTFLITGVSSGIGAAVASRALGAGHRVAGTVRDTQAISTFEASAPGRAFGCKIDLRDRAAIPALVRQAERAAGAIDVLINNAGHGHEGVFEESSIEELELQCDINLLGPAALIQAVLPGMRERRAGHIINITSMAGLIPFPGLSYYCASKFALQGLSEALAAEVAPLGVHVVAVALGQFRTDWAGRSLVRAERSIAAYDDIFDPLRRARAAKSGAQPGDPAKAAEAILRLAEEEDPPSSIVLGSDAAYLVKRRYNQLQRELEAQAQMAKSTDFAVPS